MANTMEQNKLAENIPEKAQTLDILDNDFKRIILNFLKELKENTGKELSKSGY